MNAQLSLSSQTRGALRRRMLLPAATLVLLFVAAGVMAWADDPESPVVVYASTDFTQLPAGRDDGNSTGQAQCVSVDTTVEPPVVNEQTCGSSQSTFRVIDRVGHDSDCVSDADVIYSWASGAVLGALCLDYDWGNGQCLRITEHTAAKALCSESDVVRPQFAVIGAVDVSYCPSGGIAHPVRRYTICTSV